MWIRQRAVSERHATFFRFLLHYSHAFADASLVTVELDAEDQAIPIAGFFVVMGMRRRRLVIRQGTLEEQADGDTFPIILIQQTNMNLLKPIPLKFETEIIRALERYNAHFKKVFLVICACDVVRLPPGKYPVDGKNVFFNIGEYGPRAPQEAKLESHKQYIDLQWLLSGALETHGVISVEKCLQIKTPYNPEKDVTHYSDRWLSTLTLQPGQFVVYTPDTAHAPNICEGNIKKCVFKVRV